MGPLYVVWLAAVQRHIVEDEALEPCDISQLPPMSAGTRALADFFMLTDDLLKTAYKSVSKKAQTDKPGDIAKWVKSLPDKEKDKYLSQFLSEPPNIVRTQLLKQFRASRNESTPVSATTRPRTAGELRTAAGLDEVE